MDDMRKIALLENEVEAHLVASILKERSIPNVIKSYHDIAYDGIFQTQKGWGVIYAPLVHKETILEILDDVRKQGDSDI
ncbi:MAG TPA: hypothetical protein VNT57_02720 [Desulfobacteria bacterium]|nr:hypothetical protein [Desulfobacteria bacterium]